MCHTAAAAGDEGGALQCDWQCQPRCCCSEAFATLLAHDSDDVAYALVYHKQQDTLVSKVTILRPWQTRSQPVLLTGGANIFGDGDMLRLGRLGRGVRPADANVLLPVAHLQGLGLQDHTNKTNTLSPFDLDLLPL